MDDNVLSIIIFGSHSRRDNDDLSDLDLCIITKERENIDINGNDIKRLVSPFGSQSISLVTYTDSLVNSMLECGSLFLWHLKLEGKVLYGNEYFASKIKLLDHFKGHYNEVLYHSEMFNDLKNCWETLSIPNELDLSILFTIVRNTCMILSHKACKPSFGRVNSFSSAKEIFPDLPMSIDEYLQLSKWKVLYERDYINDLSLPSPEEFSNLLEEVNEVLIYAFKKLE